MLCTQEKSEESFLYKCRKLLSELGLYFILLFLPAFTLWVSFYSIQENLLEESRNQALNEMAEMTAHMLRLTEPETYYQESLRRLSESFKWAESLEEISRISTKEKLELALFDPEGKRLDWPVGEQPIMKRASESFLKSLKRLEADPESTATAEEEKNALGYGGNSITLRALAASPNILVNFQGMGLHRMGAWFKVPFSKSYEPNTRKNGDLIAWLNLNKLEKYALAENAIQTMSRLAGTDYTFSYIDLNDISKNKSSNNRFFKESIANILSASSLKSSFIFRNELVSINDTNEGLRLICSKADPQPLPIIKNYNKFLILVIPAFFLLFIWKKAFGIKFNFSVKTETFIIFGFAALTGIGVLLATTLAYQYEKRVTIDQNYRSKAIEMLEKIDQQYSDSFSDLTVQYRHFCERLASSDEEPKKVLAPLIKAQYEDVISYAIYLDQYGTTLFQAPPVIGMEKSVSIADRYSKIVAKMAIQCLKTFNSSRNKAIEGSDGSSIQVVTAHAVEGLLADRSRFIDLKLDSDELVAFMDFTLDETDFAKGCLLIVHEPQKLENRYLNETGKNIQRSKGFNLIAFPKKSASQKSYYPRFSYISEEPLWKLNDMLNQTQLSGFKQGKIQGEEVLVAGIPGSKLKNYNLFLAMPVENLKTETFSLSNTILVSTIISLILIIIISLLLMHRITSPIKILTQNAASVLENSGNPNNPVAYSDNQELESISTGLTNMVMKVKAFDESQELCKELLISNAYKIRNCEADSFMSKADNSNKAICCISSPEENLLFMFLMCIDGEKGLKASLPLVMSGMAMSVFTEQQGLRSPHACIRNLEEYFRINLRQSLEGSVLAAVIDTANNVLDYSGFGRITLLKCSHNKGDCEIIDLPSIEDFMKDLKDRGDVTVPLSQDELSFIALTESFSASKIESLKNDLEKKVIDLNNYKESLKAKVVQLAEDEDKACTLGYLHYSKNISNESESKDNHV